MSNMKASFGNKKTKHKSKDKKKNAPLMSIYVVGLSWEPLHETSQP
jgi:hypothetical protein